MGSKLIASADTIEIGTFTAPIPSAFIATRNALAAVGGGGVQTYTRECIVGLEHAGFHIHTMPCIPDRRLWRRITNRLLRPVYPIIWHKSFVRELISVIERENIQYIFINQIFGRLIAPLRLAIGNRVKIIMLSFGMDSVDFIHCLRIKNQLGEKSRMRFRSGSCLLGRQLQEEMRQRELIDQVICLAPFEVEIERWLGTKAVGWLPRSIQATAPLEWNPLPGRFGFVGTLDHPPNYEGLILVLAELARQPIGGFELRLVGGPATIGRTLASKYSFVNYLGSLKDSELEIEATTWSAFLHPLFCFARGCSTKLAIALKWQIPIITTPEGCRGYVWQCGDIPMAHTPIEFVEWINRLCDLFVATEIRNQVTKASASSPRIEETSAALRQMLLYPHKVGIWHVDRSQTCT